MGDEVRTAIAIIHGRLHIESANPAKRRMAWTEASNDRDQVLDSEFVSAVLEAFADSRHRRISFPSR
jgi:hypothetical protein